MREQNHLSYIDTVNFGSYYTPQHLVDEVYKMISFNIPDWDKFKILDTSCGYGNFLKYPHSIGADFDPSAIDEAKKQAPFANLFHHNSLKDVSRQQYALNSKDKIIIVGNPPYNDITSIIRNEIKSEICEIDKDLKHRDMGVSFLLSYNKLNADYICVLHPLSYLIKKANFEGLRDFKKNYLLVDALVVSSGEFSATSKTTQFPIIIALYKRNHIGMTYDFILKFNFKTKEKKTFCLNQFDKLSNYITKYPNQRTLSLDNSIAFFWTMRDINALKRTRTFIPKEVYNSIRVPRSKLSLYCYADIFKEYIDHIPYYFGNSDIIINYDRFKNIEDIFVQKSLSKYYFLKHLLPENTSLKHESFLLIDSYFKNLLGVHYVDKKY